MYYLLLGDQFTIIRIDKEENIDKDKRRYYKNFEEVKFEAELSHFDNRFYGFYTPLEAKIWNARRKSFNFKRILKKMQNSEEDKRRFKVWYGENYKSVAKTDEWLAKKEVEYPEYFI